MIYEVIAYLGIYWKKYIIKLDYKSVLNSDNFLLFLCPKPMGFCCWNYKLYIYLNHELMNFLTSLSDKVKKKVESANCWTYIDLKNDIDYNITW